MEIQKVPPIQEQSRPETGPMQFGNDWPGVFIRGDNALADALHLETALAFIPIEAWPTRAVLEGLIKTLRSCEV